MTSNYRTDDPILGQIDLDDYFIRDQWLIDQFVGNGLWGAGQGNLLGVGVSATTPYSTPVQIGRLTNWSSISAASASFAIKSDGTLWVWGTGGLGTLYGVQGTNAINVSYSSPVQIGSLTNWKQVSCMPWDRNNGTYGAAAIKTDGTLWAWGIGTAIGGGNTIHRSSPFQVGSLTNWKQVSTNGASHALAVKTDGTLWAWGDNTYGQLGDNSARVSRSSPYQIGTLTNWKQVSVGVRCSAAVKTDGTLWTWGGDALVSNVELLNTGILGTGAGVHRSSPFQVGSLTNWKQVSVGSFNMAAIKTDGTLWTWGLNTFVYTSTNYQTGQLGLNDLVHRSSPVQVGSLTNWKLVSSGRYSCTAIKTNGTLWGWGWNNSFELGLGNGVPQSSPTQVGSLTNWRLTSAGMYMTHATAYSDI